MCIRDSPYAACVRRVGEPPQRLVTAEHGVHLVEGVGVVTVVGAAGEERREVDDIEAQGRDVVQMFGCLLYTSRCV